MQGCDRQRVPRKYKTSRSWEQSIRVGLPDWNFEFDPYWNASNGLSKMFQHKVKACQTKLHEKNHYLLVYRSTFWSRLTGQWGGGIAPLLFRWLKIVFLHMVKWWNFVCSKIRVLKFAPNNFQKHVVRISSVRDINDVKSTPINVKKCLKSS